MSENVTGALTPKASEESPTLPKISSRSCLSENPGKRFVDTHLTFNTYLTLESLTKDLILLL